MAAKNGAQKLNKLFETGISVAKIAQARAEEVLKDAAHISEMQRNQVRDLFEETARKSKQNTEVLIKSLRKEMEKQIRSANLISKDEVVKLSDKVTALSRELGKVSILKDEIAKLNDILASLLKTDTKSGGEPSAASNENVEPSGESSDGNSSDKATKPTSTKAAPSKATGSRTSTSSSSNKTATSSTRRTSQPSSPRRSRNLKSTSVEENQASSKSEPKPPSQE